MKSISFNLLIVALLSISATATALADTQPGQQAVFGIGSVVELQRAGYSDDVIIMTIRNGRNITFNFDTSADGLVMMKQAGFSDRIIAAILERAGNNNMPVPAAQPAAFQASGPTATWNGKSVNLRPGVVNPAFAQGKDRFGALKGLGVGAGIYAGTLAAAGGLAGSTAGMAVPLAWPVFGAWSTLRTKTHKGFSYELLSGNSSTNVLSANTPTEFNIPYAVFDDGRYPRATPVLLTLEVSQDTQTRIAGSAKAEVKESVTRGPGQPKLTEPYERHTIAADVAAANNVLTVKTAGLAAGEYAIGFIYDGTLLPTILDFAVR